MTPHLGASTEEAQDRAGVVTAEQVTAALDRRRRHHRGQHRRRPPRGDGGAGALRPALREARPPRPGPRQRPVDRVEVEFRGRLAEEDTRILGIAVLAGILKDHTEEAVNLVNAPHLAEQRGIELTETREAASEDFTELVVVRIRSGEEAVEVAGTGGRAAQHPHLTRVWGDDFYLPFAEHLAIFRYADQPGMIGRVGTVFGEEGVNIVSAAVGAEPEGDTAVMALTTDDPVNQSTIDRHPASSTASRSAAPSRCSAQAIESGHAGGRADRPRWARGAARSRSGRTPRSAPARSGSPSGPPGSTSPTRWRASGSTPTRRSRRACSATRSPARSSRSATGSTDFKPGDRVMAGTRFGGQASTGQRRRRAGAAAARAAQLRAGRGLPGQLRDRLRGARGHGRPEARGSGC